MNDHLATCPHCQRPAMFIFTVTGNGGTTQMCRACRGPERMPVETVVARPQQRQPAQRKARQGSH